MKQLSGHSYLYRQELMLLNNLLLLIQHIHIKTKQHLENKIRFELKMLKNYLKIYFLLLIDKAFCTIIKWRNLL